MRDKAILLAVDLLMLPYIWGAQDPKDGFDCSGFCNFIAWETGILDKDTDLWTQAWYRHLKDNKKVDIERGDFLFYGKNIDSIVHMMMALNDKACIGAVRGGKYIDTPQKAAQRHARIDVRPVNYRRDMVAICDPFYESKRI